MSFLSILNLYRRKILEKSLEQGGDPEVEVGLGDSALASGNYEEALASYDKALVLRPDQMAAWYNRGLALLHLGRKREAQRSFEKAHRIRESHRHA